MEETQMPLNTNAAETQGKIFVLEKLLGRLIAAAAEPEQILDGANIITDGLRKHQAHAAQIGDERQAKLIEHGIIGAEASLENIRVAINEMTHRDGGD